MSKLNVVRRLVGGSREQFSAVGRNAILGAELVTSTTELANTLAFSLWQAIVALTCLGGLLFGLEQFLRRLVDRAELAGTESSRKAAGHRPRRPLAGRALRSRPLRAARRLRPVK